MAHLVIKEPPFLLTVGLAVAFPITAHKDHALPYHINDRLQYKTIHWPKRMQTNSLAEFTTKPMSFCLVTFGDHQDLSMCPEVAIKQQQHQPLVLVYDRFIKLTTLLTSGLSLLDRSTRVSWTLDISVTEFKSWLVLYQRNMSFSTYPITLSL